MTTAYALKLWTVEDRLPGSPVVGLAQAEDGYLWLATHVQLIRFNGVEFYDVPVPVAVREKTGELAGVFCGQAQGVWVYGENGVARYLTGEWQVWSAAALPGTVGNILGMVETPDGVIRAVAERGLLEAVTAADDVTTQFVVKRCPVPPDDRATLGAVTGAASDQSGSIWMTAWNGLSNTVTDGLTIRACACPTSWSRRPWRACGAFGLPLGLRPQRGGIPREEHLDADRFSRKRGHGHCDAGGFGRRAVDRQSDWHVPAGRRGAGERIEEQDTPGSLSVNTLIEDRDGTIGWLATAGCCASARRASVRLSQKGAPRRVPPMPCAAWRMTACGIWGTRGVRYG